jgi:cysteinyl-tRNA synthetase
VGGSCAFVLIQSLRKQLEAKDNVLKTKNEREKQLQNTIDILRKAEEVNNRTVQELREKQELLQATIVDQTKTVEELNQTAETLCGNKTYVSMCKSEAVTISKLSEIPPAFNTTSLRPNILIW